MYNNLQKNLSNYRERDLDVNISFNFGARVDLSGVSDKKYRIEFWERERLEYSSEIGSGYFAATSKKYFIPWKVKVFDKEVLVKEEEINLNERNVYVMLDSRSIGDTLAWVQQAVEFGKRHNCNLYISTFHNYLFAKIDNVFFIQPDKQYQIEFYASYKLGYFYGETKHEYTPIDPRTVPLGKVASDILGIDYQERKPTLIKISNPQKNITNRKYVCIATRSTADAKHWHRERGWQDIIDYLNYKGFDVAIIQKESHNFKNVIDLSGDQYSLIDRIHQLEKSEFFIGIGSGISWLAWACNIPVIMISGFSETFAEFECERVINSNVCHGCWNDINENFDKTWEWCPRNKNFECSREISSIQVVEKIDKLIVNSI